MIKQTKTTTENASSLRKNCAKLRDKHPDK